jgi:ketosteroid isomerase-like protein
MKGATPFAATLPPTGASPQHGSSQDTAGAFGPGSEFDADNAEPVDLCFRTAGKRNLPRPAAQCVHLGARTRVVWKLRQRNSGEEDMNRRFLIALASIAWAYPAYAADDGMTVFQGISSKWQAAFNSGDAGKVAAMYLPDAMFSSGILGMLKGRTEIEAALAKMLKQAPKITVTPKEAHQTGDVVWGLWEYALADGPSGYGGLTAVKVADGWQVALHISNVTPKKP